MLALGGCVAQKLDRDRAVEAELVTRHHDPHTPATQDTVDAVLACQKVTERREGRVVRLPLTRRRRLVRSSFSVHLLFVAQLMSLHILPAGPR
jgi:hypothetical protein